MQAYKGKKTKLELRKEQEGKHSIITMGLHIKAIVIELYK